ncbi:hypothetical protein [Bacillus cereus]|uniref:hypothetical protein n=1 Tax=Bacillus cereus TaxID=1396 RepID=UPI002D7A2DB9|nr:hypothetical protein [Bacillus cereus]
MHSEKDLRILNKKLRIVEKGIKESEKSISKGGSEESKLVVDLMKDVRERLSRRINS